jgi:ATP-binding cassette, subfamily F, member 3
MIQLLNLSKSFADQELFSHLNFKLNPGNRMGFVGRNGSGKSTLFKLILGEEEPSEGEILTPKGYRIGTLKQHLEFSEPTLREEAALALTGELQYDTYRVEKILFGLGFVQEDLDKDPLSFSGGYQIRINLAKLLVTEPNLLLLDEPTNYLDILSVRWLKSFLRSFEGEVILITHDRDFMDSVSTHTMGLTRQSLFQIEGNTHKFYTRLAENEELYEKEKQGEDKKRKELEEFVARNKARASTAALAQSKAKQLEKMGKMEELGFDASLSFDFNYKESPAKVVLDVKALSFGYTPENILFSDINFTLERGKCIAIIGKNGKGKSTLLNTIAGELKALTGSVESHLSIAPAHFGQTNINRLNPKNSIMDEIFGSNAKLSSSSVRSICGAMMFSGDRAEKKISLLSGGERSRVMLGQILAKPTNLLFLDEPTNHLDMDSIAALTQAIKNFKGATIIVTHSEEMLRSVADQLIVFRKEGAELFNGGYDDFLEKIGWEDEEESIKVKSEPKTNKKELKAKRAAIVQERSKKSSPLKKEIERLENSIMKSEDALEEHHNALIAASNANDNVKIQDISKIVMTHEREVEASFELLESKTHELDELVDYYESKLSELE